jgi:uncharacterized protein YbbC (DUF1343 family)/CubicO group peptidase (beta-lactamase class C family)
MKNYRSVSGDGSAAVVMKNDSQSSFFTISALVREPKPDNSTSTQEVCSLTLVGGEVTSLTYPPVRTASLDYRTHQRNVDCRPIPSKKARNVAYCRITEKISETLFPSDLAFPLAQNVDSARDPEPSNFQTLNSGTAASVHPNLSKKARKSAIVHVSTLPLSTRFSGLVRSPGGRQNVDFAPKEDPELAPGELLSRRSLGSGRRFLHCSAMLLSQLPVSIILLVLLLTQTLGASLETTFFPEKLAQMDLEIQQNISSNKLPGGVLWFERNGAIHHKAFGNRAVVPRREEMTEDTIFDAASLTKVLATAPSIMLLMERGKIELDAPLVRYLPEFKSNGKDAITIRHLMTHTSGLPSGLPRDPPWQGYATGIKIASEETLTAPPGTIFHYSDINFIILGEVVRRVSGMPLNEFTQREFYTPLKMVDTGFLPAASKMDRIAPTEKQGDRVLRGVVHDPTSRLMGGVAGHAGLFTTASDLARFARFMLNLGELDGVRIFKPETIRLMTSVQSPPAVPARRALGWDIDSPYAGPRGKILPIGSYGHTGWTGTSIWIDPFSRAFVILLSNRNHPDESGNVIGLRSRLGTIAGEAVRDFNFAYVPGALEPAKAPDEKNEKAVVTVARTAHVLNGVDMLKKKKFEPLKGLKIGLITNHTGHDRARNPTIDILADAPDVKLKALFSPEHGIRGQVDEKVSDSTDSKTGLPIYSLYGERRSPTREQLRDLDALVFDIQDVGCRFYTYISTMGNCLEAAAKAHKKFFVLDRIDPINGLTIEGPVLKGETTFTGWHNIPVRYGMTIGELAKMFNEERQFHADLTIIQVEGWSRDLFFDQCSLPWTNPSPNMRSLTEAILYPGIGLLETTALSVGRGTDTPFEVVGAPYIDDLKLASELNAAGLSGLRFVPVQFTPTSSIFKGQICKGVNILLTDRDRANVVDVGILIAFKLHSLYPKEFGLDKFNRLLSHEPTLEAIRQGKPLAEIKTQWSAELNEFKKRREKFLIYK